MPLDAPCPDRRPSFLDYPQISQWIDSLADALRAERFVAVVAVLRGGLFPAQCAAFATGAPLHFMRYDRTRQQPSWQGEPPPPGRVLLCEDIAGLGHTLVHCRDLLARTHVDHRVLTVVSDERSRSRPDWSMHRPSVRTVLPWEREVVSRRYVDDYVLRDGARGGTPMLADHCYRRWGVDLDGVLCADLPSERYDRDLAATLADRDALPRLPTAPSLSPGEHVVVTGRPLCDIDRTRVWLDAHGFAGIEVHHRDPARHGGDAPAMARQKAEAAERLGLTDFIESCSQQAVLISTHAPQLRVRWWRGGEPVLVNALPTASRRRGLTARL